MPRRSAASLGFPTVTGSTERLGPPPELGDLERAIFLELVGSSRPEHFRSSDSPLVAAYCRAIALERSAAQALADGDAKALPNWNGAVKAMGLLSMRLRLSPQARAPNNPSRPSPSRPAPTMSYYDRMKLEEAGE